MCPGEGPSEGKPPCVDPLLFRPQSLKRSKWQGQGARGWLKGDASCARPGDRSVKKRVDRAGSGRGAVRYVSGSGGSARRSARTASRSRPTCRRKASPLGGEKL